MSSVPKFADINDEDNILMTKIRLTKNEYNATVRNKLEYNRLKTLKQHIGDEELHNSCKIRRSMHDLRKWLNDNQKVVCNCDEFFANRKVDSTSPHFRSRIPGVQSSLARPIQSRSQSRIKSASTLSRPFTAPLQTLHEEQIDTESDDETIPISMSRLTSGKYSNDRASTITSISASVLSQNPSEPIIYNDESSSTMSTSHRITWPVKLKVFALQDEDEARKQFLAWRSEQRKAKMKPQTTFFDLDLERQYQQSIRRQKEIEAFLTPELLDEHKTTDPVFAKRHRQLKLAVRAGRLPSYDPNDREIKVKMTKSKIDRARSELITVKESKIKTFYQTQQNKFDNDLSKRISTFLKRVAKIKEEQQTEYLI